MLSVASAGSSSGGGKGGGGRSDFAQAGGLFKDKIDENSGIIYTGNPEILKKICPGEYGTIKPVGYCMIGRR